MLFWPMRPDRVLKPPVLKVRGTKFPTMAAAVSVRSDEVLYEPI